MAEVRLFEDEKKEQERDPQRDQISNPKLFTQPYDLVVTSLMDQIEDGTVHLRQLSGRPESQRWYVWEDDMASKLIESILINVPIPPCYFAQDEDYKLDVIDGQQRIYSIYRFVNNEFALSDLDVLAEHNKKRFFQLPQTLQRKIETYSLRCVIVTNDSDPDIRFEVFERLNSNTVPLNAQELRNSIARGALIDLLGELAEYPAWLKILNRGKPDKRMRDQELILRFFAFQIHGQRNYRTPQKNWLNDAASIGRNYSPDNIGRLGQLWKQTIDRCLLVFRPEECFRRLPSNGRSVINRALMDLTMYSLARVDSEVVEHQRERFYERYVDLLRNAEFEDLITRSIDHKSRTNRRFELWSEKVTSGLF